MVFWIARLWRGATPAGWICDDFAVAPAGTPGRAAEVFPSGGGSRSCTATAEKAIGANGFLLFGTLTLIMAILRLAVITDGSWWRVSWPIAIFVAFDRVDILV